MVIRFPISFIRANLVLPRKISIDFKAFNIFKLTIIFIQTWKKLVPQSGRKQTKCKNRILKQKQSHAIAVCTKCIGDASQSVKGIYSVNIQEHTCPK